MLFALVPAYVDPLLSLWAGHTLFWLSNFPGRNKLSSIQGKVALVTGASRGIGAATAKMLARNKAAKVVLHYNGYKQGAEEVAAELKTQPKQIQPSY